jgi:hypothetical protein
MGQLAVCCQNLTLGVLNSRSTLSLLVGALFKKFGLFLNTVVLQTFLVHRTVHCSFAYLQMNYCVKPCASQCRSLIDL